MRDQRTLFDLTQDGLVIGEKIQRIYPEFDVSGFVSDVRTEMEGQTIYNVQTSNGSNHVQTLPSQPTEVETTTACQVRKVSVSVAVAEAVRRRKSVSWVAPF